MSNSTEFQPKSPRTKVFIYRFNTNGFQRLIDVFRWQDRLVAYEETTALWWGTLDMQNDQPVEVFWKWCIANERVGRLYSRNRGVVFHSNGARFVVDPFLVHVLVAQDNSGILCLDDEEQWYSFPSSQPQGISKRLAKTPTVWRAGFQIPFADGALRSSYEEIVMSRFLRSGHAYPIRLLMAARGLGWMDMDALKDTVTLKQCWRLMLENRYRVSRNLFGGRKRELQLEQLLRSPEVNRAGKLVVWRNLWKQGKTTINFAWKDAPFKVHTALEPVSNSAHEQIEAKLVLRDWLVQFFPAKEVETWFSF